ncbi:Dolichyl-diphosphooligosaccharide--protein glycosyltransferase subunit Swp1 [Syncephalis pseudoplumigaleata]|uniref:Dolichyl-diphosphooligosaccharide--protein glycosyltransferase subunit Swp1 n=1 Tax=Syncephalis pseudoplumigaleata TaxID=1712513 RepID=A0A4P9YV79_9FUNG|nr:Dolichyl-diphosphooligosaccharide--protein glycosyltransferase subunit Swp1 [Syncephalis pseudoplumigaleata]|eukprot:RKP23907.1 Dolichyl-diphosphooligosaccharide--protein glycosyltransferase subunit Swp1 [Syncephalis pseudoplumigaleata]
MDSSSNDSQFRLTLSEVTVEVNNPKDKARTQQEALTYPASFAKPLVVQPGDQLNIAFVLMKAPADATEAAKGVRAHQSFIVFRPQPATDAQAHLGPLVQSFQSTTSGKHRVNLIAGRFSRYFSRQPGAYDVELILGVFGAVTPIRYRLGTIDFDFPLADPTDPAVVDDEAKRAKQRALEGPPDAEYEALPEIVHQFRPAEHMPPVLFSLGYSAVVLLPWPILLALWKWIGIKPTQWPKTPAMLVTHGLFFGGISGFIFLYAAYWIKLRLLQTLAYALPLAIFTALVGRVALSDVAHRRVQATKSE